MDAKRVLELYDLERKQVEIFGMRQERTASIVRHISPDSSGLIIYSDLNSANVERVIREQVSHFEDKGSDLRWIVYQHDRPADLKDRLLAHGFEAKDSNAVLVLDTRDVSGFLLEPVSHDVRRIHNPDGIDDVVTIHQRVWQGSLHRRRARLAKRLVEAPHSLCLYVAYIDGMPASTAQVSFYPQRPFASFVRAATLPSYRGRGLFTALVATVIQETRQRGIRFIDTDASAMSRPILEKLGFQMLTWAHPCTRHAKRTPPSG